MYKENHFRLFTTKDKIDHLINTNYCWNITENTYFILTFKHGCWTMMAMRVTRVGVQSTVGFITHVPAVSMTITSIHCISAMSTSTGKLISLAFVVIWNIKSTKMRSSYKYKIIFYFKKNIHYTLQTSISLY